jgi:hypothetical protein
MSVLNAFDLRSRRRTLALDEEGKSTQKATWVDCSLSLLRDEMKMTTRGCAGISHRADPITTLYRLADADVY